MTSAENGELGRSAAELRAKIRAEIETGRFATGSYLPTVRVLAENHNAGVKTTWRALKALEADGLVVSNPRRGFRLLPKANDPDRGCPVAYISELSGTPDMWDAFNLPLFSCLEESAARRGWSVLVLKAGDFTAGQLADRLKCARAFGAIINSNRPETVRAVQAAGIPCLMLDTWWEGAGIDAVLQNGHMGGVLSANYLLARACRRVAWFGMPGDYFHNRDRLGGALAAMAMASPRVDPEMLFPAEDRNLQRKALELLSRRDRPDGVIALWQGYAVAVKRAADQVGLVLGRDLELVGWCAEETYETFYQPNFGAGPVPPTLTWSIRTMAETAMSRLAERRETPGLPTLWMKIPVTLRGASKEVAAVGKATRRKKRTVE